MPDEISQACFLLLYQWAQKLMQAIVGSSTAPGDVADLGRESWYPRHMAPESARDRILSELARPFSAVGSSAAR